MRLLNTQKNLMDGNVKKVSHFSSILLFCPKIFITYTEKIYSLDTGIGFYKVDLVSKCLNVENTCNS